MQLNTFILFFRVELNQLPEFSYACYLHVTRDGLEKACQGFFCLLFLNIPRTANQREQYNMNMGVSDVSLKEKSW